MPGRYSKIQVNQPGPAQVHQPGVAEARFCNGAKRERIEIRFGLGPWVAVHLHLLFHLIRNLAVAGCIQRRGLLRYRERSAAVGG